VGFAGYRRPWGRLNRPWDSDQEAVFCACRLPGARAERHPTTVPTWVAWLHRRKLAANSEFLQFGGAILMRWEGMHGHDHCGRRLLSPEASVGGLYAQKGFWWIGNWWVAAALGRQEIIFARAGRGQLGALFSLLGFGRKKKAEERGCNTGTVESINGVGIVRERRTRASRVSGSI